MMEAFILEVYGDVSGILFLKSHFFLTKFTKGISDHKDNNRILVGVYL